MAAETRPARGPILRKPTDQMTPRELIRKEARVKRDETIPISQIVSETDIIDENHASELGANMQLDDTGQLIRIAVRARFNRQSKIVYDVIDGFHRTEGKRRIGDEEIDAVVLYGRTDEELFDQRILAASSVRSVQYPRIAEWVTKSYASTKWAKKRIPVERAFQIVAQKSRRPQGVRLTDEELDELYDYVQEKCAKWSRKPLVVSNILQVVADADPKLVKAVRDKGGGQDRVAYVTPERLKVIVNAFPGKENFGIQNALMEMILDARMYSTSAGPFLEDLLSRVNSRMGEKRVIQIARSIFPKHKEAEEKRQKRRGKLTLADLDLGDDDQGVQDVIDDGERGTGMETVRVTEGNGEKGAEKSGPIYRRTPSDPRPARPGRRDNTDETRLLEFVPKTLEEALWQIDGLKAQVASLREEGVDTWWRGAAFLSREEQVLMEQVVHKGKDIQEAATELRLGSEKAVRYIISAFQKRTAQKELEELRPSR